MLKQLELTNFRKVEQGTMTFTDGLNVVRGANEASKSTRLEAIGYALYGTSALCSSLSECVTFGKSEKELKVVLHFGDYVFVRSAKGAEVTTTTNPTPLVTGQTDVSNFAAQLLGADHKAAMSLMFAVQGGLRGVLEDGPKGTSGLIESLADLELFDRILESAAEKLPLGSVALYEERFKGLQAQLAMVEVPAHPGELDTSELDANVKNLKSEFIEVQPKAEDAGKEYVAEHLKIQQREAIVSDISKLENQITETGEKRDVEMNREYEFDLEGTLEGLVTKQAQSQDHAKRVKAYYTWSKFEPAKVSLQMSEKDAHDAVATARDKERMHRLELSDVTGNIKAALATKITSSTCGFCGQDVSQFPEVARKNSEVEGEVELLTLRKDELLTRIESSGRTVTLVEAALAAQRKVAELLKSVGEHLLVEESCTPNVVDWHGEVPGPAEDFTADIAEVKAKIQARDASRIKIDTLNGVIADIKGKVSALHDAVTALALMPHDEFNTLQDTYLALANKSSDLYAQVQTLEATKVTITTEHAAKVEAYAKTQAKVDQLTADITKVEGEIASVAWNNALVKKIRAARPVVANKLWNLVLTSVSTLFTQIRGTKSLVTRDGSRFMVNGQSAATLSGSTKDVLGLALRVALVKTFIPNCPFLILDEPSASSDGDRTESIIGFVASCGFDQVIMVTHDPISESFASNLVEI